MIEIKNVSKSYDSFLALNDICLDIADGEIFGLVGINGAGKSTLLRLLAGIFRADSGSILVDGEEAYDNRAIKEKIFFLPDEPYYDLNSTPASIARLYMKFYKFEYSEYERYLESFKIPMDKSLNKLSKGMKRQVFLSIALAIKPKYLILDESFDGLDPLARLQFKRMLIDLIEECNSTIIISSHSLRELSDICSSFAILDNKAIMTSGNLSERLSSLHKYQIAFKEEISKDELTFLEPIKLSIDKRVCRLVSNLDYDEVAKRLASLKPLLIDEIEIDFEELFIIMVEGGKKDE